MSLSVFNRSMYTNARRTFVSSAFRSGYSIHPSITPFASPCSSSSILSRNVLLSTPVRYLNLHEYQSKDLMSKYGIRVQKGKVATNPNEAESVAKELLSAGATELIVKAQIHAGGRGKGKFDNGFKGGVKITTKPSEVRDYSGKMLGAKLITHQTTAEGQPVHKVLVHEGIFFDRELYFAILMDRKAGGPVIVCSPQGGVDIEEVAAKTPDNIYYQPVDINKGIQAEHTNRLATLLGFTGQSHKDAQEQMVRLYNLFIGTDATQVEINPFVQTKDGLVYCVDAKINFDDNASFRHKDLFALRDTSQEDQRDVVASEFGLNYIGLDGNIACMVNGAGLAMATMDIIKLHGGEPANFLDVGGGANEKQVEEAFKLLTSDKSVKAILVNIFGGIMKCDIIATGIINAARNLKLTVPLVVRLEGTNVEKGNQLLQGSGLTIITAKDLDDAAIKAVRSVKH